MNPKRTERFETASGIEMKRVYEPGDVRGLDYDRDLAEAGHYPYTRGVQATMYRSQLWTMRQYAGFGSAAETNRRFRFLLAHGQTGLSVAFDLPTQMGMDSDHPLARGEVGTVGVAIDSLRDMEMLFDGIPLDRVSTSMTINATAPVLLAMYLALAKKHGIPARALSGTVQNDILKEYIARGTYIYPPKASLRLVTDVLGYCQQNAPNWNTISISGYHIREAGSTAVQELAFTFGNAIAYVEAALEHGLDIDRFAPRLSFFFSAHSDFLEEIAKFRAARRIWATIARDRFRARHPRSMMLRFHAQTAGSTLSSRQPDNNAIRVTIQALAAVLGGAQSVHTNAKDEALALPTEEAARLALRTQQVLAHESGIVNTVDPVGGAYAIEALTNEMEGNVRVQLEKIEAEGGMLAALEKGYVQREIQDAAYRNQRAVERGDIIVVGLNAFETEDTEPIPIHAVDPAREQAQLERLRSLKEQRDRHAIDDTLSRLSHAAGTPENLMPYILAAVESYATVGEISEALLNVFGKYHEAPSL